MLIEVGVHAGVLYLTADDPQLILLKLQCLFGGIKIDRMERGLVTRAELEATRETMGRWLRYPVWIDNQVDMTPTLVLDHIATSVIDAHKREDGIGLVVIDLGKHADVWDTECLTALRQLAQVHSVAVLVHLALPAVGLPAEVPDDAMLRMPGVMWLEPHITAIDGDMTELPYSEVANVVMLMHWSLNPKTGAAYSERRKLQVVRRSDQLQLGISLWHDPETGGIQEDDGGLGLGSFPSKQEPFDWNEDDIWDYADF